MKKVLLIFSMICVFSSTYAQQLTVKTVHLRPQDARARTNPRDDAKGQKCAIIRVGVVGVENLVFPDAVGNVERSSSEYIVYVPEGLKTLRYNNKEGVSLGTVKFDDWDQEINSLASYDVIFESSDHLRSAIFSIQPANATLYFDGKKVEINNDGIAMINKPVGNYSYTVEAKGYITQKGSVTLEEDDISTVTDLVLEEQLYPVSFKVFPEKATIFIDNVPYTNESIEDLKLPEGKHFVRVTAADYQDEERTIIVGPSTSALFFTLKEVKQKVIKYKDERTRTSINIRKHWDLLLGAEGYDLSSVEKGIDYSLQLYHNSHLAGLFTRRFGMSIGVPYKFQGQGDGDMFYYGELSLGYGMSIPFGNYNQFLFTALLSGWGRYRFTDNEAIAFGTRVSLKLDISHFVMEFDGNYSPSYTRVYPAIYIGYKFDI